MDPEGRLVSETDEYASDADRERALAEARARVLQLANDPANTEAGATFETPAQPQRRVRDASPGHEGREAGLRAIETIDALSPEAGDRLEALVRRDRAGIDSRYISAVSDPHYATAWWKRLSDPDGAQHSYTSDEASAMRVVTEVMSERVMSEGTPGAGGLGVPVDLDPTIMLTSNGSVNPLRQLATVNTTTSNVWKGISSEGTTATFADELTEVGDDSPTLVQPVIPLEKAHCFIPFSIEVGMDYAQLQAELGALISDAKDQAEVAVFTSGTLSPQPLGIITGGTILVQTAGTAALAIGDIYSLEEALPPRFQPKACWVGTNSIANKVYRMAGGGSTEPPVFTEDRSRILGKHFYELSTMDTATTTAKKPLLYGDISKAFRIVDRVGLSVELIPHVFGTVANRPIGARGIYAWWRTGSAVQIPNAVRVLKVT